MTRYAALPLSLLMIAPGPALHAQDILTIPVSSLENEIVIDIPGTGQGILDGFGFSGVASVGGSDNRTDIRQEGLDNIVIIDQQGDLNTVGRDGVPALQNGDGNAVSIVQEGQDNDAAALLQSGNGNILRLDQTGDGNRLDSIVQDATGSADDTTNIAIIQQQDTASPGARITRIDQEKTGAGASNLLSVIQTDDSLIGGENALISRTGGIRQAGDTNIAAIEQIGVGNRLFAVEQVGTTNTAGIRQDGADNAILFVDQIGSENRAIAIVAGTGNAVESIRQNNTLAGGRNLASLSIAGDLNGAVQGAGLSPFVAGSAAEGAGAAQGTLNQIGGDNVTDVAISGDANMFGTDQTGDDLFASAIVEGDDNAFAVRQSGDGSDAVLRLIGDENDVGIVQTAALPAIADNDALVTLDGDRNRVALVQNGAVNVATAIAEGDDNRLDLDQTGARNLTDWRAEGNDNRADVTLTGDNNGTPVFFGPADLVGGVSPGGIAQIGDRNAVSLAILGAGNAFGLRQEGDDNRILGFVSGEGNAAAVSQLGRGNVSEFSQSGRSNSVGITQ